MNSKNTDKEKATVRQKAPAENPNMKTEKQTGKQPTTADIEAALCRTHARLAIGMAERQELADIRQQRDQAIAKNEALLEALAQMRERNATFAVRDQRDAIKALADKLADALREVKAKLGEHEGKGDPRAGEIIIEAYYKATQALAEYEDAQ